jgi:type I restriction enzyme, S subunit
MKQYEDYKPTGIEWLNEVPSTWEIVRLRYLCDITTGDKDTINKEDDGEYPFFVRSKQIERISTYSYDGEAILTAGDGDICKIWHHVNEKFDFHQRVYMLYNFRRVTGRFLYYYISENFYYDVFKLSAKNTVDSLRMPMFLNFPVLVPPPEEQIKIAAYLDGKTALINEIIAKKTRLVQLLKEKRRAVINETVTRNPGDWRIVRLRYLGKCQNGISQSAEYFGSGDPFVNYTDVYKNEALPSTVSGLARSTDTDKQTYSVEEGDVFFTRTSETIEEIGLSSTCLKTIENAIFSGFLIRFRPHKNVLFKGYSRYFFRSHIPRVHFVREMNLVTRASLSQELLKSLPVCLPDLTEQAAIAAYLDEVTTQIDETVERIQSAIEKLEEYRKTVISEAVSGKVDVRDWSLT